MILGYLFFVKFNFLLIYYNDEVIQERKSYQPHSVGEGGT